MAGHLLEEEMVGDELVLIFLGHTGERVEFTSEVTFEGFASSNDLSHDLVSLVLGDSRAKRVSSQVSSNSDSSGLDHSGVLLDEFSVLDAFCGHVRSVNGIRCVLVVVGNALIEELVESSVRVLRSSVDSDTRVLVLDTREDASFESNSLSARLVFVLFPNFLGEALFELRFAFWSEESFEIDEFVRSLESSLLLGGVGDTIF